VPTPAMVAYYRRRAAGGVGLVITEAAPIEPSATYRSVAPRFYGDDALDGWRRVCRAIHEENACAVAQIWHAGGWNSSPTLASDMPPETARLSPSGFTAAGANIGKPMTGAEIDRTIDTFSRAAEAALRLGFDGVEIHGAHGYLVDQFFWSKTNQRTDSYGGPMASRAQFAAELVREMRRRTPPDFPIIFRLSQWKQVYYDVRLFQTPDDLAAMLQPLADAGVDMFHCSTRRFWEPAFPGSPLTLAGWTKKLSGKPVIAVGSVTLSADYKSDEGTAAYKPGSIDLAARLMQEGEFDLLAVGRALIANADWADKVRMGRAAELRPYSRKMLETLD